MILLWTLVLFNVRTALLPIPIFFGALLITGTRGPIAKGLVMMTGLWAIMGRTLTTWVLRGLFALAIAAGGLFWTLSTATQNLEGTPERVEHKIERQSEEFVEGSGRGGGQSSASNHLSMLVWGYQTALQSPLGHGIAAGTKAEKLGSPAGSTETDLGDSFMALGIPGGIVYHIIVILLIVNAFQLWIKDNGPIPMAILGFMGITFLGWLGGGAYAVQPLLWFCLGAIVKARSST